jgi:lipoate-protein ligase A
MADPPSAIPWHLLVEPEGRSGADNMARDESLLLEADRTGAAFLRLYRWTPPCLSFGRNEHALGRYDRAAIQRLHLDVVRRPTGGRAVWHEHEVTYAVAAPVTAFGGLRKSYHVIHEWLAAALRTLGAEASLASARPPVRPRPSGSPLGSAGPGPCFAAPVGGEVVVKGRKVVGSAQVRHGSAFLQHGSILLDGSQDVVNAVSRQPAALSQATTLSAALGRPVSFADVADAIIRSWSAALRPSAHPRPSASPVGAIGPSAYSDPSWTWRR